jgi:hypothetical protein
VTTWEAIQPNSIEIMAAQGAVPGSYADIADCYPDLFVSRDAAKMALLRENPEQTPIEYILYRRLFRVSWQEISYRRAGARGPAGRLLYDPDRIDPTSWLPERLGEVTLLGAPHPVDETARVTEGDQPEQPAAHPAPAVAEPVAPPAPVFAPRNCTWFVDTTGDRFKRCGRLITDGRDWCHEHRPSTRNTRVVHDWLPPLEAVANSDDGFDWFTALSAAMSSIPPRGIIPIGQIPSDEVFIAAGLSASASGTVVNAATIVSAIGF